MASFSEVNAEEEHGALIRAFSGIGGLGVDESSLVSAMANWRAKPEKRGAFRKGFAGFFTVHGGGFELCEDDYVRYLKTEFSRFKNIAVLWAMHPWERDARWMHHVLHKAHPFAIIVEIACTRSSEELLGARKAYHALFHHSLEEDVAYHVKENKYANLLVGLVSAYRYEGPRVEKEMAKMEAEILGNAIEEKRGKSPTENGDVIRIMATRSKQHVREVFKYYKEMYHKTLEEDLANEMCLLETVECLDSPPKYFCKVINRALEGRADKNTKEGLARVIVSRADVDMEEIKEIYEQVHGVSLQDMISKSTWGNFKDALLSLIQSERD